MRRVIVNSTPLLVLGKIGKLDILRKLYGQIEIPYAVYCEVSLKNDIASSALKSAGNWIQVRRVNDKTDYAMYHAKLHAGEVETMILARESSGDSLVILDDKAARDTAKFLGLTVTGTLGVLVKAKQCKLISSLKPVIEDIEKNGFYLSKELKQIVLESADEQ